MAAMNQPAFLKVQLGIPDYWRACFSVYSCSSPNFTTAGMDFIAKPDMKRAQQLLRGECVVEPAARKNIRGAFPGYLLPAWGLEKH